MTIIFSIAGYPESVSGAPGETKSFQVTVSNDGDENGDVILRIKDHNGNIVFSEQQTIYVGTCYIFNVSITLPSQAGTYTWSIEAYNVSTGNVDDTKSFTVIVNSPLFHIVGYPETVSGNPSETKSIQITVSNDGNVDGTAELRIKDHNNNPVYTKQQTIYVGTCYIFEVPITLPSTAGSYQWRIEVYNINTSALDDSKTFTVEVVKGEVAPGVDWTQIFIQMLILMFIILLASLIVSVLA